MPEEMHSLLTIFQGWDGYQISLVRAIAPLSREQLLYRPAPHSVIGNNGNKPVLHNCLPDDTSFSKLVSQFRNI